MKKLTAVPNLQPSLVLVLLATLGLGFACRERDQTSSGTNWLTCVDDGDCARVPGARCRSDSICVDTEGRPIPASSGTSSSAGGNGAAVAVGGATASRGGTDVGAAASGAGGAIAGSPATTQVSGGSGGVSGGGSVGGGGTTANGGTCPAGPPAANTACNPNGLVCQYAGSSVGVSATCTAGQWETATTPADSSYVCPQVAPKSDSSCPAPPMPSYSPLVCLFDCSDALCQSTSGSNCGATQSTCTQDTAGQWHWVNGNQGTLCPEARCDSRASAARWSAPDLGKVCQTAADCFVGAHTFNCCGSIRYVSYALAERPSFDTYEALCSARVACTCVSSREVEDGTPLTKGAAQAACLNGLCQAVCSASSCQFTADCSASDECSQAGTCTWINPLSGSNLCRKADGTCGGC